MGSITIFSSKKLLLHKLRTISQIDKYSFLFQISANIIKERLQAFIKVFSNICDYNNGETYILSDYLKAFKDLQEYQVVSLDLGLNKHSTMLLDGEMLKLNQNHLNLFTANLNLHWINDLPGFLIQIYHSLQKNGVFIGTCFGSNTLKELRHSIYLTQEELRLPFTSHISPFLNSENGATLLKRAGFNFQVTDFEEIITTYPNVKALLQDLKGMGETNTMELVSNPFSKEFLSCLEKNYQKFFSDENQAIIATYEIIILTASKI